MQNSCRFGVELPYNVADVFLNLPERFFSCRLMPPGSAIPRSPHGPDVMAERLKDIGADFVTYDLRPHDLAAALNAAQWAQSNGRIQLGAGHWWTVSDFDQPSALEQFYRFRGYANQWILKSQLGLVRVYSTDPWGNEIDWEVEILF